MMTTTMTTTALAATAMLAVAGLMSLLLARGSASLRHLVWTTALGATLALPVLDASGIRIEVPVPAGWLGLSERLEAAPAQEVAPVVRPATVARPVKGVRASDEGTKVVTLSAGSSRVVLVAPAGDAAQTVAEVRSEHGEVTLVGPVLQASRSADPTGGPASTAPTIADGSGSGVARDLASPAAGSGLAQDLVAPVVRSGSGASGGFSAPSIGSILTAVWLTGMVVLLAAILFGQLAAHRLTTRGVGATDEHARVRLAVLAYEMGIRRPVRLVVGSSLRVPATWGLSTSTIVLPEAYRSWGPGTLDRVLLHELAHVHRKDCWTHLIGELARAVHWPNPCVWIAVRQQRLESERAADDRVLARGDVATDYAEDLVGIARSVRSRIAGPQAALAMAGSSGVAYRIRSILDPACRRGRVGTGSVLLAAFVALAVPFTATGIVPVASAQETTDLIPAPPEPSAVPVVPAAQLVLEAPPAPPAVRVVPDAVEPPRSPSAPHAQEPSMLHATDAGDRHGLASILPTRGLLALVGQTSAPTREQSQEHCVFRDGGRRSTSYNSDDDVHRIRWETDSCRVEIDMEGQIEFTADDRGIARMAEGSIFEIEERIGRASRRVRLDAESGGVERRYWVDGSSEPWGAEAEQWLAGLLPELFRHTTINAEARVRRMLDEGGPDRVFDEVALINSDHVASTYLRYMIEIADLGERDYVRVIDAASGFDSDHQTAELLKSVVARAGMRPAFQDPLLRAATTIDSDHQKAQVLQTVLDSDLTADQWEAVLRAAQQIDSDHQLSMILQQVARRDGLSVAGRRAYLETLESIESDHQQSEVINAFLDAGPLSADELSQVLALSANIESDHQLATVLSRVADEYELTGAQVTTYLQAAARMESDHQVAETARTVIRRQEFTTEHLQLVLDMATGVESDHQLAMILSDVIQRRTLTPGEIDQVLGAAASIESDHQLSEVLRLLLTDEDLDDDGVYGVVVAARDVGSDHQQSEVLTALAAQYRIEGEALGLYHELANRMSSHQRDQTLAVIARRPVG